MNPGLEQVRAAMAAALEKAGVRAAAMSAAVRYLHAPASVGSVSDFENMLRLTRLFLERMARELPEGGTQSGASLC